ncbi:MAG: hypothetical protein ACTSUN_02135 [Promethearchaeota archaeon]
MEAMTHNLTGVCIQILCFKYFLTPYNYIFTMLFAFLSHFLIDALSKITYHTPEARKEDKFWVIWHVIILGVSIASFAIFILEFWIGMLFANLIDIWDWLIIRNIQNHKRKKDPESNWCQHCFFHPLADVLRDKLFFFLPNLNYKRIGIVPEIIILGLLSFFITFLLI